MAPEKKHARAESNSADYIDEAAALSRPPTKRAKEIDADPPFETLTTLLSKSSKTSKSSDAKAKNVLHWFRAQDLRQDDNRALHAASQKAKEGGGSLVALFVHSPKDLEWHGMSPARCDFLMESLRLLKAELGEKNIPLAVVTAEERGDKVGKVMDFVKENGVSHVFANMEYEVDELRRDIEVVGKMEEEGVEIEILHDQTVVVPGELTTGAGGPMKVFTPYHKAWLAETKSNPALYDVVPAPEANEKSATKDFSKLFAIEIPALPESKHFPSKKDQERIRKLWPAGHKAGIDRLNHFLAKKVKTYAAKRSEPAGDPSSRMSPYFAAGLVSVREALQACKTHNDGAHFDAGDIGIDAWVREIVFREFYRHTTVHAPHGNMNLPQNLKFDFVEWEDDQEGWEKWCEGKTGVPFIDAGMRQLNAEAYMHNRLRMNTSSYLRANLLIDYRKGERYFAEHLIDWDLSNNTNGWEPSYTVFNPVVQAEKCDKEGEYIRKWVPELKDLKGKEVFAPFERLSKAEFEKLGYPKPHVEYAASAQRAKERYKRDLAEADP